METFLKLITEKISSYDLFNNLYPGVIFCYLLKLMFNTNILSDDLFENLVIFYFVGMVLSRIGSVIIEPLMKKIKINNIPLLRYVAYSDYDRARTEKPLLPIFVEANNTYRTLLSCFVCAFVYKTFVFINDVLINFNFLFFQNNKDWFILIFFIWLFAKSFVKQSGYISKNVELLIGNAEHHT